jgi:4'-phosphopantetheinyl transferase EntD
MVLMAALPDADVVSAMLGPEFSVSIAKPTPLLDGLYPEERLYVARATKKRQAEFATARSCARRALSQLGVVDCPLVPNADRSPAWPAGVKGSITHAADCCLVVVTDAPSVLSVGIDIEPDAPLEHELESLICAPRERQWLADADSAQRSNLLRLIFSAKEAFYKCHYAAKRTWVDFTDVSLDICLASETFLVTPARNLGKGLAHIDSVSGNFRRLNGFIVTSAVLRANDRSDRLPLG